MFAIFSLEGVVARYSPFRHLSLEFGFELEADKLAEEMRVGYLPWMEVVIRQSLLLSGYSVSDMIACLEGMPCRERLLEFIARRPEQSAVTTDLPDILIPNLERRVGCHFFSSAASSGAGLFGKLTSLVERRHAVLWAHDKGAPAVYVGADDAAAEAMADADVSIAVKLTDESEGMSDTAVSMADYVIFDEETLCRQLYRLC